MTDNHNELKARLKYDDDDIAALGTMLSYAILDNAEITAIGNGKLSTTLTPPISDPGQHLGVLFGGNGDPWESQAKADGNGRRLMLQHMRLNTRVLIDITNVAKAIAEWFAERS